MNKFLMTLVLMAFACSCMGEPKQALTLHMYTGGNIVYILDDEPIIEFEGQNMIICSEGSKSSFPMHNVIRWEIGVCEYEGELTVEASNKADIIVCGNMVRVFNPDQCLVQIFNAGGMLMTTDASNDAHFTLQRGIYIVTISDKTYKIAIR